MGTLLFWKNFLSLIFSSEHLDASTGRIPNVGINQYMNSSSWLQEGHIVQFRSMREAYEELTRRDRVGWYDVCLKLLAVEKGDCNVSLSMGFVMGVAEPRFLGSVTSSEPQSNCV